jgi:hypothetical protein
MWIIYVLVLLSLQNRHLDDSGMHDYSEPLPTIRAVDVPAHSYKCSCFHIFNTNMNIKALHEVAPRNVTFTVSDELAVPPTVQGGGSRYFRSIGTHLPKHTVSYPRIQLHIYLRQNLKCHKEKNVCKKKTDTIRHGTLHAISERKQHNFMLKTRHVLNRQLVYQ